MNGVVRGVVHLLVALLIGSLAGWGAVEGVKASRERQADEPGQALPPAGTRVQAAIDAIREDGVYVSPDARDMVGPEGERKIEAAVAQSGQPVHVIVWAPSTQDGDWLQADDQLKREFAGEDSLIYLWEGPEKGEVIEVGRELEFPYTPGSREVLRYSSDFVGDPANKLAQAVRATKDATWEEPYEADSRAGLITGGIVLGILAGLTALAVLGALMLLLRRRSSGHLALPGGWTWTGGGRRGR